MLGRSVMSEAEKRNDLNYPFRKTVEILSQADIAFFNLESPIVTDCPPHESGYKLCTKPEFGKTLAFSGVDVVSIANNHSLDYGYQGRQDTKNYLEREGILYTDYENFEIIEKKGIKFGFLAFDFTLRQPTAKDYQTIESSKKQVDFLFVSVHWGVEYQDMPTDFQRVWADKIISSGADVIVGHHPHWVQTIERRQSKVIYYSLGNFIFDQDWSEETKKGLVVRLTFGQEGIIEEELLPTYQESFAQPSFIN